MSHWKEVGRINTSTMQTFRPTSTGLRIMTPVVNMKSVRDRSFVEFVNDTVGASSPVSRVVMPVPLGIDVTLPRPANFWISFRKEISDRLRLVASAENFRISRFTPTLVMHRAVSMAVGFTVAVRHLADLVVAHFVLFNRWITMAVPTSVMFDTPAFPSGGFFTVNNATVHIANLSGTEGK